jgi:putative Mn2+ efflux pump MntP
MAGMRIGSAVGDIVGNKADILGGAILVIIAVKTALENLILS